MALPLCHMNPYDVTSVTTTAQASVGQLYSYRGSTYMYVLNAGSGAGVAGELGGIFLTTPVPGSITYVAAEWLDGTLGTVNPALGMCCYATPAGSYAYVLRNGITTTDGTSTGTAFLKTDGGVVKGDYLVPDGGATPDGNCDTAVAGEEHGIVGYAIDDDTSGNLVIAHLNIK